MVTFAEGVFTATVADCVLTVGVITVADSVVVVAMVVAEVVVIPDDGDGGVVMMVFGGQMESLSLNITSAR